MQTLIKSLCVVGLAGLMAACTNDTTSYIDPDYKTGLPGNWRIVADGTNMTMKTEEALIGEAKKEFGKIGQTALSATEIIPPTRDEEITGAARLKAFGEAGGEAVLEITRLSKETSQRYSSGVGGFYRTGGASSTTVVRERGVLQDGQIVSDRTTVVSSYYPAFYHDSFYATNRTEAGYRARLIDIKTGKVIWQADSAVTRATSRDVALVRQAVEQFVDQLVDDGVIADRSN